MVAEQFLKRTKNFTQNDNIA